MGKLLMDCVADAKHRTSHQAKQRLDDQAAGVDEFEYKDDPYAKLAYSFDEMFDDIHVEHAKAILRARALKTGAPQLGPEHWTCTKCNQQLNCAFAFDPYNIDGDCIMTK